MVKVVCVGKSVVVTETENVTSFEFFAQIVQERTYGRTSAAGWCLYLGVFGQQACVSAVNAAQLFHHLVLMLLLHKVLGVDPVAQISG